MSRIAWIDATAGVAGDMVLGALIDLGVLDDLAEVVGRWPDLPATVDVAEVRRGGQRAVAVTVTVPDGQQERRLADVLALVAAAPVDPVVRGRAANAFRRLAAAEAAVHGIAETEVHFHEVGAVDALVDVVGGCLGLHRLAAERLVVSQIGLGEGRAVTRHGVVPIPGPAVLELLTGTDLTAGAGPADFESATPTGVALLAEWASNAGTMPAMAVAAAGVGAGGRDVADRANVLRIVTGTARAEIPDNSQDDPGGGDWFVVEANVDDLDPRLWPAVLDALLAAGAADAWLTPILMKKGRPAHTVHALAEAGRRDAVGRTLLEQTSTIGFRWHRVGKQAADREWRTVDVSGRSVRVKVALTSDGRALTATPEWEDVRSAAESLGVPPRRVLLLAHSAAAAWLE